ncbi:MAG: hypothetical protein K2H25_00685, partial [Alistipes sp.]|nr:hypothetical protein [Alistipes sp.]
LIRLHNDKGGNLSADAPYQIGDRWEMGVTPAWNSRQPPHIEDRQIIPFRKIDNIGIEGVKTFIKSHNFGNRLISGSLENAFEGCLNLCGTKNFVNEKRIPTFSTQFWITDQDLRHTMLFGKHYYFYNDIRLTFVGFQEPIDKIPADTLIRLSLANWWDGDGSGEKRCYLQLSGWYL